ncbi:unnamed protein product [Ectocarpus sp. 13 AM-2016]
MDTCGLWSSCERQQKKYLDQRSKQRWWTAVVSTYVLIAADSGGPTPNSLDKSPLAVRPRHFCLDCLWVWVRERGWVSFLLEFGHDCNRYQGRTANCRRGRC